MRYDPTVLMARTRTGLIVRGGPGVHTMERGEWSLVVDDLGQRTVTRHRMEEVLEDAATDPIAGVMRHFRTPCLELFVLSGPPGVIAGSAPQIDGRARVAVRVGTFDATVGIGFVQRQQPHGWQILPAGNAVCWGPEGPEVLCDLGRRWVRLWPGTDQTGSPSDLVDARTVMSVSSSS